MSGEIGIGLVNTSPTLVVFAGWFKSTSRVSGNFLFLHRYCSLYGPKPVLSADTNRDRQLLAGSQFLATGWTVWFPGKNSVCVQMTWVGPLPLCVLIHPKEVLVPWSAAEPGLSESHSPSEEELTLPWFNPTLAGHLHKARPALGPAAPRNKHLCLLSVKATQGHSNRGLFVLH